MANREGWKQGERACCTWEREGLGLGEGTREKGFCCWGTAAVFQNPGRFLEIRRELLHVGSLDVPKCLRCPGKETASRRVARSSLDQCCRDSSPGEGGRKEERGGEGGGVWRAAIGHSAIDDPTFNTDREGPAVKSFLAWIDFPPLPRALRRK